MRICWTLLGGFWGAWLVVRRLLGVSINGDTFGGAAYWLFGIAFACLFFIVGAALAALTGHQVERLMRRMGVGVFAALASATVVTGVIVWQAGLSLQAMYPGLRPLVASDTERARSMVVLPQTTHDSRATTCRAPRPLDTDGAKAWDSECR